MWSMPRERSEEVVDSSWMGHVTMDWIEMEGGEGDDTEEEEGDDMETTEEEQDRRTDMALLCARNGLSALRIFLRELVGRI